MSFFWFIIMMTIHWWLICEHDHDVSHEMLSFWCQLSDGWHVSMIMIWSWDVIFLMSNIWEIILCCHHWAWSWKLAFRCWSCERSQLSVRDEMLSLRYHLTNVWMRSYHWCHLSNGWHVSMIIRSDMWAWSWGLTWEIILWITTKYHFYELTFWWYLSDDISLMSASHVRYEKVISLRCYSWCLIWEIILWCQS